VNTLLLNILIYIVYSVECMHYNYVDLIVYKYFKIISPFQPSPSLSSSPTNPCYNHSYLLHFHPLSISHLPTLYLSLSLILSLYLPLSLSLSLNHHLSLPHSLSLFRFISRRYSRRCVSSICCDIGWRWCCLLLLPRTKQKSGRYVCRLTSISKSLFLSLSLSINVFSSLSFFIFLCI
jgi:hypothetical protein